jgi:hypothetical protein
MVERLSADVRGIGILRLRLWEVTGALSPRTVRERSVTSDAFNVGRREVETDSLLIPRRA